ncbi:MULTISPECIES: hypothetical protein [unclassified Clostridium]|nr:MULTISPECIES: hypothetical protein [unclassified Clostridium]
MKNLIKSAELKFVYNSSWIVSSKASQWGYNKMIALKTITIL